jgi:general secretion pathway protein C
VFADFRVILYRPIVPKLLFLLLAFLLLWQVTTGVASFFSLDKAIRVRHDQPNDVKMSVKHSSLDTGLKTTYFGDYVPKNLSDADVKQSNLNLTVVGIMFSDNEEGSHVIIQIAEGKEQTFGIGDKLPGGAIIKRITSDGVLIGRNGSLERLILPKNALTFEPPAKPLGVSE